MKIVDDADAKLISLIDEVGFFAQVKVGISRYYLVPLLTLSSLLATFARSGGSLKAMTLTALVFLSVMSLHLFMVHRKGARTEEMAVNVAVEGLRSSSMFLIARTTCFIMFAMVVLAQSITYPWKVPISCIEFFFLFYPTLVYQHEPPPRHEMRAGAL